MNIGLWISQSLLALLFTVIGIMKVIMPINRLSENMKWVETFPVNGVRAIGVFEIVLGLFILLPRFFKTLPNITISLASYGIIVIMLGAVYTHFKRQEYSFIAMNVFLLLLAVFVVYAGKRLQVF
ncbi:MAG: DoxX family protein [Bacteroidota bacterium]